MKKAPQKSGSPKLPPGVSRQFRIQVDTENWFPQIPSRTKVLEELYSVTFDGKTYKVSDFRNTRHYSKNHIYAGQFESAVVTARNLVEFLLGRPITVHTSKSSESSNPRYDLNDFLSEFLYQVKGTCETESEGSFDLRVWYIVDVEDIEEFEKDLAFVSSILRKCTFRFWGDLTDAEQEAEYA
jgi:hypothetical protein